MLPHSFMSKSYIYLNKFQTSITPDKNKLFASFETVFQNFPAFPGNGLFIAPILFSSTLDSNCCAAGVVAQFYCKLIPVVASLTSSHTMPVSCHTTTSRLSLAVTIMSLLTHLILWITAFCVVFSFVYRLCSFTFSPHHVFVIVGHLALWINCQLIALLQSLTK